MAPPDQTPAVDAPPGKESHLLHPRGSGDIWIGVLTLLMAIMFVFVGLRFYVKQTIKRAFVADDWTTILATIGTCLSYVACILAIKRANFGTHAWDVAVSEVMVYNPMGFQAAFFISIVTVLTMPFAKSSFFLMYLRLFSPYKSIRFAVYFGLFVNWGLFLAIAGVNIYYDFLFQTHITEPPSSKRALVKRGSSPYIVLVSPTGSLALDLYILLLPIIPVWRLHLGIKMKLRVIAVFATGLIACVASSLNLYFRYSNATDHSDPTYDRLQAFGMILVELCVGVTASCMPPIAPLLRSRDFRLSRIASAVVYPFQRLYSRSRTSRASRTKGSDGTQTTTGSGGSIPLSNMPLSQKGAKVGNNDDCNSHRQSTVSTRCFAIESVDDEPASLEAGTRPDHSSAASKSKKWDRILL